MKIVEPRTLSGFMELLPSKQIMFDEIKNKIEEVYKQFGFLPIDTPIIELSEVLLAKAGGETEKQIYSFKKGDTDISLRFDLTVPLAKYVAKNQGVLAFPFRRYQIGKVYRGERTQKGRYREFYQCDVDIVGEEDLNIINDAELPSVIDNIFKKLDIGKYVIKINNRKILTGLFMEIGQEEKSAEILRVIDKIDKIGKEKVVEELQNIEVSSCQIAKILGVMDIFGTNDEKIQKLEELNVQNDIFNLGVNELKEVVKYMRMFGILEDNFVIDTSIARGLDYYTGTVYETFLVDHKELGSICSGGRYEALADNYTNKKLPGVGISIGLTRLFSKLDELNLINEEKQSTADVLIIPITSEIQKPIELAKMLRANKINTEINLQDKKIKTKMKYADKLQIPYVIVIGDDEISSGQIQVKNMKTGTSKQCCIDREIQEIYKYIKEEE